MTSDTRQNVVGLLQEAASKGLRLNQCVAVDGTIYSIARSVREHAEEVFPGHTYRATCHLAAKIMEEGRWP